MNQLKNMLDNEMLVRKQSTHGKFICILKSHMSGTCGVTLSVISAEPWMGMMGNVLKSLEAVMFRMNGDVLHQQDSMASNCHRESERHTGYIQVSHSKTLLEQFVHT